MQVPCGGAVIRSLNHTRSGCKPMKEPRPSPFPVSRKPRAGARVFNQPVRSPADIAFFLEHPVRLRLAAGRA